MSTIFKLIVTGLMLNACVQLGRSSWAFYEFQDAVQQAVLFSTNKTAEQLEARVRQIANEQGLPVDPDTVVATFQGVNAHVTARYVDNVRLVPGGYVYKWAHALEIDMRRMAF
jgi:hypothetical protein